MKIKVAARVLNEMYFLNTFIEYYLDLGVDEIHFFDSKSTDKTVETIKARQKKNPAVKLILSHKKLRRTSYSREVDVCNRILQHAIKDYKKKKEETWWILADIDEFLVPPAEGLRNFLNTSPLNIIRSVFLEWYLPIEWAEKKISARETLDKIRAGEAKGRLTELWGDPFYKDYILRLSPETTAKFAHLRITSGNHRFLLNGETVIPQNTPFFIIDHLRGVSIDVATARTDQALLLLEEQQKKMHDNWEYEHFKKQREDITNYRDFYRDSLNTKEELEALLEDVGNYDNSLSLYNKMIFGS
jgi:hypothetical protein